MWVLKPFPVKLAGTKSPIVKSKNSKAANCEGHLESQWFSTGGSRVPTFGFPKPVL